MSQQTLLLRLVMLVGPDLMYVLANQVTMIDEAESGILEGSLRVGDASSN